MEINAAEGVQEEEMPESFRALPSISNDEEEEDVCRICRNNGDLQHPLHYPCACSGSIKYVHQDCLLQWLNHSNARRCEAMGNWNALPVTSLPFLRISAAYLSSFSDMQCKLVLTKNKGNAKRSSFWTLKAIGKFCPSATRLPHLCSIA
eukprot:Gb_33867 [translate_table: standard]